MDTRRARIERRLGLVGRNLPALYRDAVSLVDGATRLEGASHTVGGHLREVESALREVLMALIDTPRIRNTKENHQQEVEVLLARLDLASKPSVAPLWRSLAKPDDEWSLHRLTHRNALDPPRPIDARFRQFWDDAEAMLDGILDAFEERFVDVLRRLDELLVSREPQVKRLRNEMPNTPAVRGYFFDRLRDPAWLAPLHEARFFDYPPDPQPVAGGTLHPDWPEARYLRRMAAIPEAQLLVAQILGATPGTGNLTVQAELAEVLVALPARLAAPVVGLARDWLGTPGHTRIGETLAALADKLARDGEVARALDVVDVLIGVEPREHPPVADPADREAPPWVSRKALPRIPLWEYEQALERHIVPLTDVVGLELLEHLGKALDAAVRLSHVRGGAPGPEDYSHIWAPALEDDHALGHDARGLLLVAVRRAAERLVTRDPGNLGPLLEQFARRPWYVFQRLALHLIHRHPERARAFSEPWLLEWSRFDAHQLFREYALLLRDVFQGLSPEARATILGWIDAGPDLEEIRAATRASGNPPPDEEQLEGYEYPEPTPDDDERGRSNDVDPHSASINTVRGLAMHAVIHYALWIRRHLDAENVARGFEEMPEVREVLENHLDPARDPSPAVRAVYGQWFPQLVLLHPAWARANVVRIFEELVDERGLGDIAWSTYLLCAPPHSNVAPLLHDVYRVAVERLGRPHARRFSLGDPDEHLADHLMTLAARGELSLRPAEGILARFFERATPPQRRHALATLGRRLGNVVGSLRAEIRRRVEELWRWRREAVRAAHAEGGDPGELAGFGPWFLAPVLPVQWGLPELVVALELTRAVDDDSDVIERLAAVARDYPGDAVRAARLMVDGDDTGWKIMSWRGHLSTIIAQAVACPHDGTRAAARALVSVLVSRCHVDFRTLLPPE